MNPQPGASRLVSPTAHRWPGGTDDEPDSSSPAGPTASPLEPTPGPAVEAELAVEAEPAPEAWTGDAPESDPAATQPPPHVELEPAARAARPGRSRIVRAWSAIPRPLRIALALFLLPPTGYVIAVRSGWSVGIKLAAVMAWTALLLAPVVLTRVPSVPVHLPGASATPPALAIQDEVAATTPSSRGAVIASPTRAARPGPTIASGRTPAPGSTSATTPATTPSRAPAATPTLPGAPPPTPPTPPTTPAPTPVTTPVDTCGAPPNPWGYNFCGGNPVTSPQPAFCSVFNCVPNFSSDHRKGGYVVECWDGTYAYAGDSQGSDPQGPLSCTAHGGKMRQLYGP